MFIYRKKNNTFFFLVLLTLIIYMRRQAMSKGPSSSVNDHQRGTKRKLSSEDCGEVEEISIISPDRYSTYDSFFSFSEKPFLIC